MDTMLPRIMLAENIPAVTSRVAGTISNITRTKRNTMKTLAVEEEIHRYWIWEGSLQLVVLVTCIYNWMDSTDYGNRDKPLEVCR